MTREEEKAEDARIAALVTDKGKECLKGDPGPAPPGIDAWAARRFLVLHTYKNPPVWNWLPKRA